MDDSNDMNSIALLVLLGRGELGQSLKFSFVHWKVMKMCQNGIQKFCLITNRQK